MTILLLRRIVLLSDDITASSMYDFAVTEMRLEERMHALRESMDLFIDAFKVEMRKVYGHGAPGPSPEERCDRPVVAVVADPIMRWRARALRVCC